MTFRPERIRASWSQTWRDLWSPLLKSPSAPLDLVIEMVREVARETRPTAPGAERRNGIYLTSAALNRMDLDQDLSSVPAARAAFRSLKPGDFKHRPATTRYPEAAVEVIDEFDQVFLKHRYMSLVEKFVVRYNLTYRVDRTPFRLVPLISESLTGLHVFLTQLASDDDHLTRALDRFTNTWAIFVENENPDVHLPIAQASLLAEAFAGKIIGQGGALGQMISEMRRNGMFPHAAVGECVSKMYGFCSDYPLIRHGTNQRGVLRELEPRDALFASLVLLAFAGYVNS